jgi:hypothetical protein
LLEVSLTGEEGCVPEDDFFFLSDFLRRNGEDPVAVWGARGKKEASRSGMGGGGARREGCSASNASARRAVLDLLLRRENIDDFALRIWFTLWLVWLVLFVDMVDEIKLELELSIRSRRLKGRSSSAEWRLLRSSMDMLSESDLRG